MTGLPSNCTNPGSGYHVSPRRGRINSRSGVQGFTVPQGQQQAPAQTPSYSGGVRPTPTVKYDIRDPPTDLQRWNGNSLVPFLRWAYAICDENGNANPNYNYEPDIDNAIYWSETIDAFDNDPRLAGELVLYVANPALGHPWMDSIIHNRSIVQMLLYRHYQRHGGLILPPIEAAREFLNDYDREVQQARQLNPRLNPTHEEYPHITFPSWAEQNAATPRGPKAPQGKGPGEFGSPTGKSKGRGQARWPSRGDNIYSNQFRRGPGGGSGGGSPDGGVPI